MDKEMMASTEAYDGLPQKNVLHYRVQAVWPVWPNFATLAKSFKSLAIFGGLI